jgi:hypothetical protein
MRTAVAVLSPTPRLANLVSSLTWVNLTPCTSAVQYTTRHTTRCQYVKLSRPQRRNPSASSGRHANAYIYFVEKSGAPMMSKDGTSIFTMESTKTSRLPGTSNFRARLSIHAKHPCQSTLQRLHRRGGRYGRKQPTAA